MSDNNISQQQRNDNSIQEQEIEQQNQQNNPQINIVSDENGSHIQTEMNQQPKLLNNQNNPDGLVPQQLVKASPQNFQQSSRSPFKVSADLRKSINFGQRTIRDVDKKAWFEEVETETKQNRRDVSDACCLEVGSHHFCCSTEPTNPDYINFGVGINLYYRFLKQIGCFFIAFTILALPQMILSVIGYLGSQSRDSQNPFEFLMATTIGATSLNNKDCQIQYFYETDLVKEFSLQCESGNLAGSSFHYGIINSNEQDCLYLSLGELNLNTTNQNSMTKLQQQMDSQVEYSFSLTQLNFDQEIVAGKRVYAGARCKEATVNFGLYELKQKYVPIIFASCDAAIIILFIYFLLNLTVCESKFEKLFQTESPMLQNFSLQISNLPKQSVLENDISKFGNKKIQQFLLQKIREHIENKFKLVMKDNDISIYDIQASEQEAILLLQANIQRKKVELNNLLMMLQKGRENQFLEAQQKQKDDTLLRESYVNFFANFSSLITDQKDQDKIQKVNNQINKIWEDIGNLTQKIDELQNVSDIKYIWITFDNMKQKELMQYELQTLPIDWLAYSCCFCCLNDKDKEKLFLKKFKLQLKEAPNPENINWMNLNYSLKQRVFRQFISFILTIAFLAGSFTFVSWVNQQKLNFQQQYPSINCNNPLYQNVTIEQVQLEVDGVSSIKGFVECYCKPHLQEILAGKGEDICYDWGQKYAFQQTLPWAIVAGLIIINVLIQYIFIFLSSWEKHLMITEEYAARILKIFLAQFLNTGLILLISNADFGNSTKQDIPEAIRFLFGGKYGDIDSKWCQNIGIVLLLTLLINVATQPVTLLLEIILRYLGKAYDQMSCCLNQSSTRKTNKTDFRELYLGEQFRVDLRYAQILTAIYVCLMYSAALPFLYLTTVLTILFIYAVDKVSLFTTYRKPLMLDQNMSQAVRKYLWLAVIIHLGFATYIYGSSNLFYETLSTEELLDQFSDISNNKSVVLDWWERSLSQAPNIVLLCILALVLLTLILFFFFYRPMISLFSKCFACCNERIRQLSGQKKYEVANQFEVDLEEKQFLKFLNKEELEQDLKFTLHQQEFIQNVYDMKQFKIEKELQLPINLNKIQIKLDDLALANSQLQQTPSKRQKNQDDKSKQQIQKNQEQNKQQIQQQNESQNNDQSQIKMKPNPEQLGDVNNNENQNDRSQLQGIQNNSMKKEKHLVGLRSYHISYNPGFSKYYEWDRIKEQSLIQNQNEMQ